MDMRLGLGFALANRQGESMNDLHSNRTHHTINIIADPTEEEEEEEEEGQRGEHVH